MTFFKAKMHMVKQSYGDFMLTILGNVMHF